MKTLLSALLLAPTLMSAQYNIAGHVIAGGTGTSTGGVYRLGATAGQSHAAVQAGSNYTVVTGFWALSGNPVLAGPRLSIQLAGDAVRVSWPLTAGDIVLEETETLDVSPIPWVEAHYPLVTNGTHISATIPLEDDSTSGFSPAARAKKKAIRAKKKK